MIADVFYPMFTLTITILAFFYKEKKQNFSGICTHMFTYPLPNTILKHHKSLLSMVPKKTLWAVDGHWICRSIISQGIYTVRRCRVVIGNTSCLLSPGICVWGSS